MVAHTLLKATLNAGVDRTGAGVVISAQASTQDGPIPNANIAERVIGPGHATLGVTHALTDGDGRVRLFIPVDWTNFPPRSDFLMEARLSPTKNTGPANLIISIPR